MKQIVGVKLQLASGQYHCRPFLHNRMRGCDGPQISKAGNQGQSLVVHCAELRSTELYAIPTPPRPISTISQPLVPFPGSQAGRLSRDVQSLVPLYCVQCIKIASKNRRSENFLMNTHVSGPDVLECSIQCRPRVPSLDAKMSALS